jgi:hypothetical protein
VGATARPWAFEGLRRSVGGLQSLGWVDAHILLGQALWWACLLDETCWGEPGYGSARDASPAGRVLPGLRYARNAMGHGAAPVRSLTTFSYDGEQQPYEWIPADLLDMYSPPRSPRRPHTIADRAAYSASVSGRPLEEPLQDALRWFEHVDASDWDFPHSTGTH